MKNYKILILIIAFAMTIGLVGCSSTTEENSQKELEKVKIMLDWVPNTNHTGIYVAKEQGWYEEQGLDVEILQSTEGGTSQIVAAGKAEFGISYQEEVTYARANDLPVVSIATIIQHNTSGFASPKEKEILSPKDFEGKKYGGWGSPIELAIIQSVMEKEDADVNKVEIVNVGATDFFTVTQKDVDFEWIYYGWTGIEAELRDYPINFIDLKEVAPELDFYTPVIISSEDYINQNPETVKKFIEATSRGYEYAIANPEEAATSLLGQTSGLNEELVIKSQEWLSGKYQDDAKQWGLQRQSVWEDYAKWMYDHQLIPEMIDVEKAFTNEFLPER